MIGCNREFGLDVGRINGAGSGISLGHPVGATGVRLIVTMIHQLQRRNERFGLCLVVRQRRPRPCLYRGGPLKGFRSVRFSGWQVRVLLLRVFRRLTPMLLEVLMV